ncbi:hypothetical protein VNX24_09090 [Citrobacter farmeri]|uniref:hypothetical protein n=1 Tax=Citrobacter farmeri TaxID=67824 RepID=UPI002DB78829|nr:hypothetical protein [Citrobacter farmeri]MEC3930112.1 hypothetical protein [Citrobacter farmeri]
MKPSYEELEAQTKQLKIDVDCYKKGMEASNARLVQLAAENAKLADCANFYRLGFKPVKGAFGIEYRPTEQLLDDCGNTAIEAIKTPATDAFLAEVRAQGVEMAACALDDVNQFNYANMLDDLAQKLRKGGTA